MQEVAALGKIRSARANAERGITECRRACIMRVVGKEFGNKGESMSPWNSWDTYTFDSICRLKFVLISKSNFSCNLDLAKFRNNIPIIHNR